MKKIDHMISILQNVLRDDITLCYNATTSPQNFEKNIFICCKLIRDGANNHNRDMQPHLHLRLKLS